jgi:hypothetical protein
MRVLLLAGVACAWGVASACAGDVGGSDGGGADGGSTPQICPPLVYTGLVPASTMQPMGLKYSVPVLLLRGKGTSWASSNSNVAIASGDDAMGLIQAVGQGNANVSAINSDGTPYTIPVQVKVYPADSNLAGNNIYDMHRPNCNDCHDSPGQSNVTSAGVSDKTDQEVIDAFTKGIKAASEGGGMLNVPGGHMFSDIMGADQLNVVSFLRSIHTRRPPGMDTCR